jgi:hypothetical protein
MTYEFSRGTWAIHRPGWYEHHHAAMRRPDGNVILAGSELANGWAGSSTGAIESGLHAAAWAQALDQSSPADGCREPEAAGQDRAPLRGRGDTRLRDESQPDGEGEDHRREARQIHAQADERRSVTVR